MDPIIKISPRCGKLDDHRLNITVIGFSAYGTLYWEPINSKHVLDTFGYFKTNITGGFNDYTIGDDLHPNEYTYVLEMIKIMIIILTKEEKR
jgi:hypothetical protein